MQVLIEIVAAQPSPPQSALTLENMGRCKCKRYRPMFSQCASPSNTGAATASGLVKRTPTAFLLRIYSYIFQDSLTVA